MNPTVIRAAEIAQAFVNRLGLHRKRGYVALFLGEDGKPTVPGGVVLADLRKFCRADATTFDADPRVHALIEGRREVWLRIQGHLNIPEADFARLDPTQPQFDDGDEA